MKSYLLHLFTVLGAFLCVCSAADDPKAALDILTKLGEYTTPKLARVENKHEVDEGITKIELEFVKPKD